MIPFLSVYPWLVFLNHHIYNPRQMNIPVAALLPRISVNNGKATVLSITARRIAVMGEASNIARSGRQSCFGSDVTCVLKSPNQGANRNQLIFSGMKVVSIRGAKDRSDSPWDAKPMTVISPRAIMSPAIRVQIDLSMLLESTPHQEEKYYSA